LQEQHTHAAVAEFSLLLLSRRILSLLLLSASLSSWMRAHFAVCCLRAVTFDVPSTRARTHTHTHVCVCVCVCVCVFVCVFVYVYVCVCVCVCVSVYAVLAVKPAGATKRGSTNLQATRSWQDTLCMLRAPLRPCICLPRTPCTCRRWAPCTRRCMHSLRWRRLLHFRAHRCTRASSHRQTRTRQKISVCVYVGIFYVYVDAYVDAQVCEFIYLYVCLHVFICMHVCMCMYTYVCIDIQHA
jgi:hypothetical protein